MSQIDATLDIEICPETALYPASTKSNAGYVSETPVFPGSGEPGYGCGRPVLYRCNDCGHVFQANTSCLSRECPNCYEKWASREGKLASWRMWTGSKLRADVQGWDWNDCRIVHAVVSFRDPPGGLDEWRARAREIARKHNLDGGLMVCHPFDLDGFIKFHVVALAHGEIAPGGIAGAMEFMNRDLEVLSDLDREDLNELSTELAIESVWFAQSYVFKVIRDAEREDFRGFQDVASIKRAVQYLLTHCGIYEGRHALTWWGSLSYRSMPHKLLVESFLGWDEMIAYHRRCPKCKSLDVEPLETPQDFGWRSVEPIHHSFGYGVPWGS